MDQQKNMALYWVLAIFLLIVVLYYFGLIPANLMPSSSKPAPVPNSAFAGLSVNGVPGSVKPSAFDFTTTAQIVADSTNNPQYSITGLPLRDGTWNNYPVPLSYSSNVSDFGNLPSADVLDTL